MATETRRDRRIEHTTTGTIVLRPLSRPFLLSLYPDPPAVLTFTLPSAVSQVYLKRPYDHVLPPCTLSALARISHASQRSGCAHGGGCGVFRLFCTKM